MSQGEAEEGGKQQSEPSAVMERLSWRLAWRDDRRVAQALYAGEEMEEMHELSEAGLLDEFFAFLEEIGMMAVVEQLDLGVQRCWCQRCNLCCCICSKCSMGASR
jgi:hypothetical protein